MNPFSTCLPVSTVDRSVLAASSRFQESSGFRGAVVTGVVLPDGYVCRFVGRISKTDAVRNAIAQQAKGTPSEEK